MVVGITAHRKGLSTNKSAAYSNKLTNLLADFFLFYFRELKPSRVIAGGALGGDTGAAVAALRYGTKLTIAIPHYGQEARWSDAAKNLYYRVLDRADSVIYVEQGAYASWKMQSRNRWMVDHSDMMLALWSGGPGGTANCIQYAEQTSTPVRNLWEEWLLYRQQYKV